jgi:2'-5' RNA ligase
VRLFVGIEVTDGVRRQAGEMAGALRRSLGRALAARWVALENLHLTVRFIGHVPDERVSPVLAALTMPLAMSSFEIELAGCGRFPPRGGPRVLWIGLTRGLPGLAALHQAFDERLLPFGYEPENRAFTAHLTLARLQDTRSADAQVVDDAIASVRTAPVVQSVDRVTLFESRLSPKGPSYHPIDRIPLRR